MVIGRNYEKEEIMVERNFEKEELMNEYRRARKAKDYKKMLEFEAKLIAKGY